MVTICYPDLLPWTMYIPESFRETRTGVLHAMMRENSFGTLVSQAESGLIASHVPILLDADHHPLGILRGHLAMANPHWKALQAGAEAMVIFQGPHAYISPSWYADPGVPTWNYTAVHAYGKPRLMPPSQLRAHLAQMVSAYESARPVPWRLDELPEEFIDKMQRAIVGFEIEITRLDGKWKLSQNRSPQDRQQATAALRASDDPLSHAIAELMD